MANPISGNTFNLELDIGQTFVGSLSAAVDYKDPLGNTGSWSATLAGTIVTAVLGPLDTPYSGTWEVQAYVVDALGVGRHGTPVQFQVDRLIRGVTDTHP